jgi:hypothetical protein
VVILTANTLLIDTQTWSHDTSCQGVRTLNFSFEETNDWRTPIRIAGLNEMPLSLWNTTKPQDQDPVGWFDYYTAPSPNSQQTAALGAFMGQVVGRKNASMEICGTGWNCTFEIQFVAPGYKCTELGSGIGGKVANFSQQSGSIAPPFDLDILLPTGPYSYYAFTSGGEYATPQMKDVGIGGIPNMKPPYPKNLGAFRTEPVIWIGYSMVANLSGPLPSERSDPRWNSTFIPKLFACEHYETAYKANISYVDTAQVTRVTNRTFLQPIINTTYVPKVDANDGTADNTTATPRSNYVFPSPDVGRYRKVAAYHSLGLLMRSFINGTVQIDHNIISPFANTAAIQTKLLDPRNNYFPRSDLDTLIQDFYQDIILSLLSNTQFVDVVWAARPDELSGTLLQPSNASAYMYPCIKSRTAIVYSYHARDLWIVYGIAILLTLLGLFVGAYAIRENDDTVLDTRFSSIVAATRGPGLDRVGWVAGRVPSEVKRLRAGYGMVSSGRVGLGVQAAGPGTTASPATGYESPWQPVNLRFGFALEGDVQQVGRGSGIFGK